LTRPLELLIQPTAARDRSSPTTMVSIKGSLLRCIFTV
jgi:hypothetical protein